MSDLIRREDAIEAYSDIYWIDYRLNLAFREELDKIDEKIRNIPTVDIADRPQGEWIITGRTNIYGGIEVQCSNCGDRVMVQHLEDEWYCRHCGADMGMKGADDEV